MIIVDKKTSYSNRTLKSDDKMAGQVLVALGDVKGALKQYDDVVNFILFCCHCADTADSNTLGY